MTGPNFEMDFINVSDDLSHSVKIIMELRIRRFKNVCYFDLVVMVTIQGLSLAKNCNKRNSKTKGCMTVKTGIDVEFT